MFVEHGHIFTKFDGIEKMEKEIPVLENCLIQHDLGNVSENYQYKKHNILVFHCCVNINKPFWKCVYIAECYCIFSLLVVDYFILE